MKHDTDYFWVGMIGLTVRHSAVHYTGSQVSGAGHNKVQKQLLVLREGGSSQILHAHCLNPEFKPLSCQASQSFSHDASLGTSEDK